MLLAASPGGTTANLFSHLFRGDVALNITLTAVNSLIAVVTLPVITNLAIDYFDPADGGSLGLQFGKTLQVFAIVLVPVVIGMLVRQRAPAFADRMDKPVRIVSAVVLALVIVGTIIAERENIAGYISRRRPARAAVLPGQPDARASSSRARSASCGGRRSPARSRSACTTAPWRSRSRSACWTASSSPSRPRSTA